MDSENAGKEKIKIICSIIIMQQKKGAGLFYQDVIDIKKIETFQLRTQRDVINLMTYEELQEMLAILELSNQKEIHHWTSYFLKSKTRYGNKTREEMIKEIDREAASLKTLMLRAFIFPVSWGKDILLSVVALFQPTFSKTDSAVYNKLMKVRSVFILFQRILTLMATIVPVLPLLKRGIENSKDNWKVKQMNQLFMKVLERQHMKVMQQKLSGISMTSKKLRSISKKYTSRA
jgi:hypothetical protein